MPIDARELIAKMEWAATNDLRELVFCIGKTQVTIRRKDGDKDAPAPSLPASLPAALPAGTDAREAPDADVVTAPLAGLCHLGSEAGAEPFVSPGDMVTEGQTLCVIEAMKVMTSIPAPRAGRLDEVLVADGTSVDVGAPLVRLV